MLKTQIESLNLLDLLNDEINMVRSIVKKGNLSFDDEKMSAAFEQILNILDITFDELIKFPISIKRNEIALKALDLELYGSEIIRLCIDELYNRYVKNLSKRGLEILSKDVQIFLKWENPINTSGYYNNYEKYQIKVKSSEMNNIFKNLSYKDPNGTYDENYYNIDKKDFKDNFIDEEKRDLQNFIVELELSLNRKKKLKRDEYFKNSTDIESIYRLYAIFHLESENKIRILKNLEVELND